MIEIYATVVGVLQCTFPRVLSADSCDKLAILFVHLQKQRPEILFLSLRHRRKEPYIVSVWSITSPPCCASKGSIPFCFLHTSLHPYSIIFPQKYATTSSSIYRPNALLSVAEYGNMSDTKEATA